MILKHVTSVFNRMIALQGLLLNTEQFQNEVQFRFCDPPSHGHSPLFKTYPHLTPRLPA
jgi:hypothetical protein